jgi:hypothetical protein
VSAESERPPRPSARADPIPATLIVLFSLKEGRSADDYERWARETDVPTGKGLPSVGDFRV